MMKSIFRLSILLLYCISNTGTLWAQGLHWQCNPYNFQYDMTVYLRLANTNQDICEVAAFCGDECRGVGSMMTLGDDTKVFYMRVRSNVASGEQITFCIYNTVIDKEIGVDESILFESQAVVGLPSNPLTLTVVLKGDVNGDGVVDAQDASLVLQLVAKKIAPTADGIVYAAADVNGDGKVDAQDASLILQYAAKKISW